MLPDYPKEPNETRAPLEAFVTRRKVIQVIDEEAKKATDTTVTESITNSVEDTIADVIQVRKKSAKEVYLALILHSVEEVLIDIVQHSHLDTHVLEALINFLNQTSLWMLSPNQW